MITLKSLIIRYLRGCLFGLILIAIHGRPGLKAAEEPAPYATWFDPAKGFKPAQANFQVIFLQMAGSFEYYGSPEPWIRHIIAEHSRIDAKYKKATGKDGSSRPSYFTDDYLEDLAGKWNQMAPVLTLRRLTLKTGADMRHAIMGSWNMSEPELVALETNLTVDGGRAYGNLLRKDYFTKADFPATEAFYGEFFDKLTEDGKAQISRRTWLGSLSPEKLRAALVNNKGGTMLLTLLVEHQRKCFAYIEDRTKPKADAESLQNLLISRLKLREDNVTSAGLPDVERDALRYAHRIRTEIQTRLDRVRSEAKEPGQANAIENALMAMVGELAVLAQSEYKAALFDGMLEHKATVN